jgi:hypothetical protein
MNSAMVARRHDEADPRPPGRPGQGRGAALEAGSQRPSRDRPVVGGKPLRRPGKQRLAQSGLGDDPAHQDRHGLDVGRIAGQHRIAPDLGQRGGIAAQDRHAVVERLEQRHAKALEEREIDERLRPPKRAATCPRVT